MIQTDKKRVTTENMPDYGKNGRRSLRYRQKNILERDWSKTKMTLREFWLLIHSKLSTKQEELGNMLYVTLIVLVLYRKEGPNISSHNSDDCRSEKMSMVNY